MNIKKTFKNKEIMKIKRTVLIALMGIVAFGCQKECILVEEQPLPLEQPKTVSNLYYAINDTLYNTAIQCDEELDSIIGNLLDLAYSGDSIKVFGSNPNIPAGITRDVVTYTTGSQADAKQWVEKMIEQGYTVEFYYDKKTEQYICIASKKD